MDRRIRRTIPSVAAAALVAAALVLWLRPAALEVQVAPVRYAPLQVTVEELGETRAHDRYVVAAPVPGRLQRLTLRDGDAVDAGDVVATLDPLPLSTRERDELQARVAAAEAAQHVAEAQLQHVTEDLAQAERERMRVGTLFGHGVASRQQLEQAQNLTATLAQEAAAAQFRVTTAAAELRGARAGLRAGERAGTAGAVSIALRSPTTGRVLRILEPSERVVAAGTPILSVGDLSHLEVVLEMLSSEAVRVRAGMPAELVGWGGEQPLRARVRLVEPYAFTKVSALGVEEKRTRVILELVDPPGPLGDGYRVTGRITVWSSPRVLTTPIAALFRCGASWCVYAVEGRRARQVPIRIGERNDAEAQVLSGLSPGEQVVTHPPGELGDGMRVRVVPST